MQSQQALSIENLTEHCFQDATQRVRQGLAGLKIHLELEDRYFQAVAELAQDWHVRPAPDFKLNPEIAPFLVDLSISGADVPPEKESLCRVDLGRNADGSMQVVPPDMDLVIQKVASCAPLGREASSEASRGKIAEHLATSDRASQRHQSGNFDTLWC